MPTKPKLIVQSPRSHRNRDRIRLEVPPSQAEWLLGLIAAELKGLTVDDDAFASAFALYSSIKKQVSARKDG